MLTTAVIVAVAVLSTPFLNEVAHAEVNCTPSTCGTHRCSFRGRTYEGGQWIVVGSPGHQHIFSCDGFTGTWIPIGRSQDDQTVQSGPQLP